MRMSNANMFKEASEKHSIRKSHIGTLGHTYHPFGNVVGKIKGFSNGETVDHVAETSIRMVLVSGEAYDEVFDRIWLHESTRVHQEVDKCQDLNQHHLVGMRWAIQDCDGESSIQATNEADAFVELKNKHGANLLVDIEKTIKSNGCESRAKIRLVSK
ncbi:hypothetical protein Tco_1409735, partial [Tanacetum coccineum]